MDKQRLQHLAGIITEAQHISIKASPEERINIFMRYATENWESDIWPDAVYDLIWRLYKADPQSAQEFVEGNLEGVVDDDTYGVADDQQGVPAGNRVPWNG